MTLPELCIKRPVFATVLSLVILLVGLISYQRLSVREYPRIDEPVVSVNTTYRGASAEVVESQVTKILEDSLSGIEGVEIMTSQSRSERSQINVRFRLSRNPDSAAADVRDKVSRVRAKLPDAVDEPVNAKVEADSQPVLYIAVEAGSRTPLEASDYVARYIKPRLPDAVDEPVIAKVEADSFPVLYIAVEAGSLSPLEASDYISRYIKPRLSVLPGAADVRIFGERQLSMRINIDRTRLAGYKLTVQDVEDAIRKQNAEIPAGRIESTSREFTVVAETDVQTPEQFGQIIIANVGGYPVRIRDVGTVQIGAAMDVSQWKRADALLVSEHHVLELIAGGSELPVVLDALCQRVENHLPGAWCSILLLAEDGAHWQHGAAPSLPVGFTQALDGGGPEANPCGAFLGAAEVVEEIASSPRWAPYADLASQFGLRWCWSMPFHSASRQLLGSFAIYYRPAPHPGDSDREVVAHAMRLAAVAVERWRQIAGLKRLATTDQLTGLRNRAHFMDSAAAELRRFERFKRELTMLMIDIDFFKLINDRYGHAAGDEALRVFSRVLVRETRAFDLLGRIGGEEFAVLLSETGGEAGMQIAERLRQAIEASSFVFHDSALIRFTVSVGVALCHDGDSLDSLLARADDALYRAKHAGRNRVEVG